MIEAFIFIVLGLVIFAPIFIGEYLVGNDSLWDLIAAIAWVPVCGGLLLGFIVSLLVATFLPTRLVNEPPVNIVSLRDNTTGTFFLGTGRINDGIEYFYYEDLGHNTYQVNSVYAGEKVTIVTDNPKQPYLAKSHRVFKYSWFNLIGTDLGSKDETYQFHIPKGSITSGYNLNAK